MLKKNILLFILSSFVIFGFAQKSKRKTPAKSPKSEYFVMTINGETTPAEKYCPDDTILFSFTVLDSSILEKELHWEWYSQYHFGFNNPAYKDIDSIKLAFPINHDIIYPNVTSYNVSLVFNFLVDTVMVKDTLTAVIKIDYERITMLETSICYGRDITITMLKGDTTFYNVTSPKTVWDTLPGLGFECDTLLRYFVDVDPLIIEIHAISSCGTVVWGDSIIERPLDLDINEDYKVDVERVFLAYDPDIGCDTLKILTVTIIGEHKLNLTFDQEDFCKNDDTKGTINLETNFTAFDWTFIIDKYKKANDRDSSFTVFISSPATETSLLIEYSGYYKVKAYMDTSLYDTLKDLRIVNCFIERDTVVADCTLIIPNVITPNGDGKNDILGIKKLNPVRDNELTIHDRWGKTVFKQRDYKCVFKGGKYENIEEAFAGLTKGGQKLPDGTYYYSFVYDAIPKKKTYTGTIVILR